MRTDSALLCVCVCVGGGGVPRPATNFYKTATEGSEGLALSLSAGGPKVLRL